MANLKISPEKAILLLEEKIGEIERMIMTGQVLEYYEFIGWCSGIWSTIDAIFGDGSSHPDEIRNLGVPTCSCSGSMEVQRMLLEEYHSRLLGYIDEIQNAAEKQVH